MNRDRRISELLGEADEKVDNSLRGRAWERAHGDKPPRTLTPYEWEEWYAAHGVPDEHRAAVREPAPPWWRRWLRGRPSRSESGRSS